MKRLTIVVASKNPVKINAATDGLKCMFPDVELLYAINQPPNYFKFYKPRHFKKFSL